METKIDRDAIKERARARMGKISPAPAAFKPDPPPPVVPAFYDSGRKTFWAQNARGEWMELTESSLRRLLQSKGWRKDIFGTFQLSQVEEQILFIQQNHDVHYAGPLAGYGIGPGESAGSRILITRGPVLPKPRAGDFGTLKAYLRGLLADQLPYFLGWLKSALVSLRAGPPWRPGQMLAIAGPAGCGKSLAQGLITEILGGRPGRPYRYMTGKTDFNSELFGSEHLAIEDEASSTDIRTRRIFGQLLKNLIVNEVQSFHAKGRPAVSLTPFWRVTITLNDEAENLMVLPPLDESLKDKIILLRATQPAFPFSSEDLDSRKKFRSTLSAELPGFLAWLQSWRIPEKLRDVRYGVKGFQNLDLVGELDALAPELRLLGLIETLLFIPGTTLPWTGSAAEMEQRLREGDKTGEVARTLSYSSACGVYLARLSKRIPTRIFSQRVGNHQTTWTVNPPG